LSLFVQLDFGNEALTKCLLNDSKERLFYRIELVDQEVGAESLGSKTHQVIGNISEKLLASIFLREIFEELFNKVFSIVDLNLWVWSNLLGLEDLKAVSEATQVFVKESCDILIKSNGSHLDAAVLVGCDIKCASMGFIKFTL